MIQGLRSLALSDTTPRLLSGKLKPRLYAFVLFLTREFGIY